jgi:hypothetical protein
MTLNLICRRLFIPLLCAVALCACRKSPDVPQAGDTRAQIYAHLTKKTGQKQFTPALDTSLSAEELSKQEDPYIRSVREQMRSVPSYDTLYRLIGQQLATADRLLAHTNADFRRTGLRLAREACGHAMSDSVDTWLAARICEAYFWPHLDVADAKAGSHEHALDLLQISRRVFFDSTETNHVLTNYYLLLARAPDTRAADTYRVEVADWLEEKGDVKLAHAILSEIRDTQVLASASERITRVKERATAAQ